MKPPSRPLPIVRSSPEPGGGGAFSGDPLAARIVAGLSKVGLALRSRAQREAGSRGLSPTQGQILALLRARAEAPGLRLGAIAEALAITPATASDAVAALARKGLVRKRAGQEDARAVEIGLTAKGRREAERAAAWPDVLLGAVEELGPEEQAAFLRALVKMVRALQERGEIPVQRMCVTCRFFCPNAHPGDPERPHHCDFVDAPFGDRDLRLDCPDQEPAAPAAARRAWAQFAGAERRRSSSTTASRGGETR